LTEEKHPPRLPALDIKTEPPALPLEAKDTATASPPPRTLLEAARKPEPAAPVSSGVRVVSSKTINLDYAVKDAGASGVAECEVWYTRDGKSWAKHSASSPSPSRRVVQVDGEGRHGFSLVPRSGAGLGKEPPRPGDEPQLWVEVDETKPDVRLLKLVPVAGAKTSTLAIHWSATDKHLLPRPIRLSYAEQAQGPWKPIADGVENNGYYEWQVPSPAPVRIMVRAEATDEAGNVGVDQMPEPVVLDQNLPAASILDVSAAKPADQ
jgi:hypothetical protein